jgi:RNA polymerase sigma factor (sigma-70 family)
VIVSMSETSVSEWIQELKEHTNEEAAQQIYERYIRRLIGRARAMLGAAGRRVADEEDIAAQAIQGLFEGVAKGRFPRLNDRNDLWQVLMRLVRCRVIDHWRRYQQEARLIRGESVFGASPDASSQPPGMNRISDDEPTPEEAAEFTESLRRRLAELPTQRHRQIALWKLEGRTNDEIAGLLGCTTRTVEYALNAIRKAWEGS